MVSSIALFEFPLLERLPVNQIPVQSAKLTFIFLFIFRYLRLIVHIISFYLYKPTPVPDNPTILPSGCTLVFPTVEPNHPDIIECLETLVANKPGTILIVTVGNENLRVAKKLSRRFNSKDIKVTAISNANKRSQVCHVIPRIKTPITILVDDHVFWPSKNFLPTLLAPFENHGVGIVGTNKRARRSDHGYTLEDFWNCIGCLYLERHNFEICATNNIDGGAFVVSGRTIGLRTQILQDQAFIENFENERFFFGLFGPLITDDDNFITRWIVRHGWKIAIQYSDEAVIETTLGTYPRFLRQCLRWVRTTWRSNSASLFTDRTVWTSQPWCVYAVYITSFFNFALFYDLALIYTLKKTTFFGSSTVMWLVIWILATKLVKPLPHFWRYPGDLVWLPGYVLFGYYHSLVKLYAVLTFWNTGWGGRTLMDVGSEDEEYKDEDENKDENFKSDNET